MDFLENLNDRQQEAVLTTEGPLLILAGAGSGKTRVLTNRTAYLIHEKKVAPWQILAITFTNKAAGEMRRRIDEMAGFGADQIWVSTFHSTCVRILRRYIDRLGYENNFTIYDTDDQKNLMKDLCKRLQIDTKIHKERSFLNAISRAKDEMVDPVAFSNEAAGDYVHRLQAQVYQEYQQELKRNNALDFDDLLLKTVELFKLDKEVLQAYQERFRYIMVDEYQDTNLVQFEFVRLLAGKYKNLCVVGDDDQSIYKFRGANIYNILNFEKYFPDTKVVKLEQNYRSTQIILDAANAVISHNVARKDKRLWTAKGEGTPIGLEILETSSEEADLVAREIRKKAGQGIPYKDMAVLYRTNAQSRSFEERFVLSNIPYKVIGGVNFYARKEIKDLLCYLKTVDNGRDDLAVKRILNVPKRGIGAATVRKVENYCIEQNIDFYTGLCRAGEIPGIGKAAVKIRLFVDLIRELKEERNRLSVSEMLEIILEQSGYEAELVEDGSVENRSRLENIGELISKAADYDNRTEKPDLGGFLEQVALVADIDSLDPDQDYVVLMTIHSAKGLEFEHVFMPGMEDGLFPGYVTIVSDHSEEEMEEERRLCYVGITRAKQTLTLTAARCRMLRGKTQYNMLSRFVREIPPELVTAGGRKWVERAKTPGPDRPERYFGRPGAYDKEQYSYAARPGAYDKEQYSYAARPAKVIFTPPEKQKDFGSPARTLGPLSYQTGDRVRHIKFGEGRVTSIAAGGRDYEVTVDFDRVGTKKMFAAFAKLKKI